MLGRIKVKAVWLAIGLVFGGVALATAGEDVRVGDRSAPDPVPSATDVGKEKDLKQNADDRKVHPPRERKQNHGFYVSKAAKCEPVTDGETSFTPPENCAGKAKGAYVRDVAKSDLGKKPKPERD